MKKLGVKKYQIVAVVDSRTSDICLEQNKKEYDIEEFQAGKTAPPFHVRCRSTIAPASGGTLAERFERLYADDPVENKSGRTLDEMLKDLEKEGESRVVEVQRFHTASSLSDNLLAYIKQHESIITKDMKDVSERSNGRLGGLEHKLKTRESLTRKILDDSQNERVSLNEAALNINDALRYTTIFEEKTFGDDYIRMKKLLISQGYDIIKVKNTWGSSSPYRGVNTVVKRGNLAFEMQYHTEASFTLKNGLLHKMHEEFRDINTSKERKKELTREMIRMSNMLPVPGGIERVD